MTDPLRSVPEHLIASGAIADDHSQNVFVTHSAADSAIESSLFSWAGQSQTAMTAKAGEWATLTTTLTTRLYSHAEALRTSGLSFADMDNQNAEDLDAVYKHPGDP
ncbi:WXG100 family type VII secretion target [Mycolicibacterium komossense]|uniref:WXG100 family type VII secretion target n=1 Tax=Mycolicibacterium komossense TaxID=1779 RepID=A0ABT3CKE0_9MYCO|nr:hypothetical protein [Mycolicibacterium komossense]MCV7229965.1 hypothetical protein [Mycolicibacterium komossense]